VSNIASVIARDDMTLSVTFENGRQVIFDVKPYLGGEAFLPLQDPAEFKKVSNGGYFIEWDCGADFSADTIEAFALK
jgi:hypothetical protein